ncbi:MAG: competence/damage-inducible protein A [Acidimicrobiia bacterium]|nr:competence/damage-inducible protein A [Acidimicrobiia bacterium]
MNAEIIAVGSEMLTPARTDTNSLWLTDQLNQLGIEVVAKMIVGDDRLRLATLFGAALLRADLVILTGGLGPTEDDVTREAVAQAMGRQLLYKQELEDAIAARFRSINRPMAEINRRQAFLIDGFEALSNPRGTAPGQWGEMENAKMIALLPGPPNELKGMYTDHCLERLRKRVPPQRIATLVFRVAGMGESDLDQLIAPVYTRYTNPVTTVLAKPGDVQIHLRARCWRQDEADALLAEVGPQIESLLGDRIYSRNGDDLETATGKLLLEGNASVSVAESCTGGLLASRITSVPGSSGYFRGGFLVYTNAMKQALLGIEEKLIAEHTEVSEEVARAMAEAARARTGATHGVSVTGYAGPDGGTEANPVGTVFLGLATPAGTKVRRVQLFGDRHRIRSVAATSALDLLRRSLLR